MRIWEEVVRVLWGLLLVEEIAKRCKKSGGGSRCGEGVIRGQEKPGGTQGGFGVGSYSGGKLQRFLGG